MKLPGPKASDYTEESGPAAIVSGAHPGGRSYETFPVNANEAEARRQARFSPNGHTQGRMDIQPEAPHPAQPYSLDLRFPARD